MDNDVRFRDVLKAVGITIGIIIGWFIICFLLMAWTIHLLPLRGYDNFDLLCIALVVFGLYMTFTSKVIRYILLHPGRYFLR